MPAPRTFVASNGQFVKMQQPRRQLAPEIKHDLESMSSTLRKLGLIWLAWTAAGLFYATQDFTARLYRSETVPWVPVVAGWMVSMYICAAFTPLLLWLG